MGSTGYTQITPTLLSRNTLTTWTSTLVRPTSSGVYFDVGDAEKAIVVMVNGSTNVDMYGWIEPSTYWDFSRQAITNSSGLSSGTGYTSVLPISCTVCSTWISATANLDMMRMAIVGPFETGRYRSSDGHIYIRMSTDNSTYCGLAVIGLPGSST